MDANTAAMAAMTLANTLVHSFGAPIKQYTGQIQVTRAVQAQVPGKHFNNLTAAPRQQRAILGNGGGVPGAALVRAARQGMGCRAYWARN